MKVSNRQNPGAEPLLEARDNWRVDYFNLMGFVTRTLNTAYAEYEGGRSGGLAFKMYKRFGELLQNCRDYVKEKEIVVLVDEEAYTLRTAQAPAVRQGVPQSAPGPDEFRALKNEVSERVKQLEELETTVDGLREFVKTGFQSQDNEINVTQKNVQVLKTTVGTLQGKVNVLEEQLVAQSAPGPEEFRALKSEVHTQGMEINGLVARKSLERDETEALAALAARVAALEKPWYKKLGATKASGQPEARESTLLQRMEALNS